MSDPLANNDSNSNQPFADTQAVQRIPIPVAARGIGGALIPERTMGTPDPSLPFYRDMEGWEMHDGFLSSIGLVSTHAGSPSLPTLSAIDQVGLSFYERILTQGRYQILITNEEIWHYDNDSLTWTSLTPQYKEGTCSATNGSTTVFFQGDTRLDTRGHIQAGQIIDPGNSGTFYEIASITNKKELELTTAYTGSTISSQPYTIRHNFRAVNCQVYSRIFNNDLVVAWYSNTGDKLTGVCQVTGVWRDDPDPARFLVANVQFYDEEAKSGDVDVLSELVRITGLEMHTDGRVMIAGEFSTSEGGVPNRLAFSSNADRFQWGREPAGDVDLVGLDGQLGPLHRYGEQICVHFTDGMMIGFETGDSDPPLSYEILPTVTRGATHTRAIKKTRVGHIYPHFPESFADTPNVYLFDGSQSIPIGDPIRDLIPVDIPAGGNVWAYVDNQRSAYHLFITQYFFLENRTMEFVYYWDRQQWTKTTRQEQWWGYDTDTSDLSPRAISKVANASLDEWHYLLGDGSNAEVTNGGRIGNPYLTSEWLDARRFAYDKTWIGALALIDTASMDSAGGTMTCQIIPQHAPGSAVTSPSVTMTRTGFHQLVFFSWEPVVAEAAQFTITFTPTDEGSTPPDIHALSFDFQLLGQSEGSGLTVVT